MQTGGNACDAANETAFHCPAIPVLTLSCGAASRVRRSLLFNYILQAGPLSEVSFIVPTELQAANLRSRLLKSLPALKEHTVLSWPGLNELLTLSRRALVLLPAERLAVIRSILMEHPRSYHLLLKNIELPTVTGGVLTRISKALDSIAHEDADSSSQEMPAQRRSPRSKQLRKLAQVLSERMEQAGAVSETIARNESWLAVTEKQFQAALPGVAVVVFDGFDQVDNTLLLALRKVRDLARQSFVLLDYNPQEEVERYPHVGAFYDRVYEIADKHEFDADENFHPAVGSENKPQPATRMVIRASGRYAEVTAIARHLHSEIDRHHEQGKPFHFEDYVLCFPAHSIYAPLVEQVFREYSLPVTGTPYPRLTSHLFWRFLEAISTCVFSNSSISSMRSLLKTPFLLDMLSNESTVTRQNVPRLIRTLDYFCQSEGIAERDNGLLRQLRARIDELHEMVTSWHTAEPDVIHRLEREADDLKQLEFLLNGSLALVREFATGLSISEWHSKLTSLLVAASAACTGQDELEALIGRFVPPDEVASRLLLFSKRLTRISSLLQSEVVSFPAFVSLLRLLIVQEPTRCQDSGGDGFQVAFAEDLPGIQSRQVIIAGMVDGEFPAYLSREANLAEDDLHDLNQSRQLSRQKYLFDRIMRKPSDILYFLPAMDEGTLLLPSQFLEEQIHFGNLPAIMDYKAFQESQRPVAVSSSEMQCRLGELARRHIQAPPAVSSHPGAGITSGTGGRHGVIANIVWNACANAERIRNDAIGMFDGILSDPSLLAFLITRAKTQVHSISQLDLLVQCPFHYFAKRILDLQPEPWDDDLLSPGEAGEIVHSILFDFFTQWTERGKGLLNAAHFDEAAQLLHACALKCIGAFRLTPFNQKLVERKLIGNGIALTETPPTDPRKKNCKGLLRGLLELEVEKAEQNPDMLAPRYFEIQFGLPIKAGRACDVASQPEPVILQTGNETIALCGRADRIDTGASQFSIIDYKTGYVSSISDQLTGYRVQIPVYLMVFEKLFRERGLHLEAAGGMFYALTSTSASVKGQFFRKSQLAAAGLSTRIKGFTDEEFESISERIRLRIADGLIKLRTGQFHVTLAPEKLACSVCEYAAVCRKDLVRAQNVFTGYNAHG